MIIIIGGCASDFSLEVLEFETWLCHVVISLVKKLYSIPSLFTWVGKWVPELFCTGKPVIDWHSVRERYPNPYPHTLNCCFLLKN